MLDDPSIHHAETGGDQQAEAEGEISSSLKLL
jgi:hypothetical protein